MKIGIDIVDLQKFEDSLLNGGQALMDKVFTPKEISQYKEINKLAGVYAVKEAFIKAVSDEKIKMNTIEVMNNKNGKPVLREPRNFLVESDVELSIAHDGNYVVAICVINMKR